MAVIEMRLCAAFWTIVLILSVAVSTAISSTVPSQNTCEAVHKFYNPNGNYLLPNTPVNGPICGEGSCCGQFFETTLINDSKHYLDRYLKESIGRVATILDTRAKKFDESFRDLLLKSKKDFHEMFKKTYGIIYIEHSNVFSELFKELEKYYTTGQVTLSDTMEKFFNILYLKMFKVINSQYQYTKPYLDCVQKYMNDLKPFGDVPQKLKIQLTRSFVATRTLYKTLSKGAATAQNLLDLKTSEECGRMLVQLRHCGTCTNQKGPGPCSSFCIHTMQHCLEHYTAISDHWDNFVEAVDKISERLLGPFNIEAVVEPINIKISEAIMNFQENGNQISEKIFSSCGKPDLERRRRSPDPKGKVRDDEVPTQVNSSPKKKHHKKEETSTTLEKIIRDIRQKIKETKLFWKQLPYQFCNEDGMSAPPSQEGGCWNGTAIGNFSGVALKRDLTTLPPLVHQEVAVLQALSQTLEGAHQGHEVELPEGDEEIDIISGSGSGDDGLVDQEDGDDDEDVRPNFEDDDEDHRRIDAPTTTRRPEPPVIAKETPTQATKPTSNAPRISSYRAIISYVLPIILVWFGGTIADLL